MNSNKLLVACQLALIIFCCSSCQKESADEKLNHKTNQWIETNMRHWYYWYNDIPAKSKLNYSADPELFFNSLLSKSDGKTSSGTHYYYSTIQKKNITTRNIQGLSLGFEFQNWRTHPTQPNYAVNVLYVLPNSPAQAAGLHRGDWILRIDGVAVNSTNIYDLLGTKSVELSVGDRYNTASAALRTIKITPAVVEDNPILYSTVFQDESTQMRKVGYLVYNHFTSGPDGADDKTYDEQLQQEFQQFKHAGVDDFILDLRYNGGGLVTSSQLLSQMLAPQSALGQVFCDVKYNDVVNKTNTYLLEQNNENLNLTRLFVLTSNRTASASEALINGLRPFYSVYLLGEKTEGKNVGSVTLENNEYNYELHPIVCRIYNSKGESDYENGFTPFWELTDNDRMLNGHIELGDKKNDILLSVAIEMVSTGSINSASSVLQTSDFATPEYCSLSDKSNIGIIE